MTCVTVDSALSPAINVRSNTPLVQKVNSVFGETLLFFNKKDYYKGLFYFATI